MWLPRVLQAFQRPDVVDFEHVVGTTADANEAMALVDEFAPRLIMMDLQLPGMDGLALTRRLKPDPRTRQTIMIAQRLCDER